MPERFLTTATLIFAISTSFTAGGLLANHGSRIAELESWRASSGGFDARLRAVEVQAAKLEHIAQSLDRIEEKLGR
jgi:hypothetical protein